MYGCIHCDVTADTPHKIRPHLKAHAQPKAEATKLEPGRKDVLTLLAREVDKVTADRDRWKARALKAERSLATLRRALTGE